MVQNGLQTRFWEDWWIGNKPLKLQYPTLYRIVRKKNQTVASVLGARPLIVSFRRSLVNNNLRLWLELVSKIVSTGLTETSDVFVWGLTKNLNFTVKSLYTNMMQADRIHDKCIVWKAKVPLKIKIFLWYLKKCVLLTKDNLIKRNWKGEVGVVFVINTKLYNIFFRMPCGKICLECGVLFFRSSIT